MRSIIRNILPEDEYAKIVERANAIYNTKELAVTYENSNFLTTVPNEDGTPDEDIMSIFDDVKIKHRIFHSLNVPVNKKGQGGTNVSCWLSLFKPGQYMAPTIEATDIWQHARKKNLITCAFIYVIKASSPGFYFVHKESHEAEIYKNHYIPYQEDNMLILFSQDMTYGWDENVWEGDRKALHGHISFFRDPTDPGNRVIV